MSIKIYFITYKKDASKQNPFMFVELIYKKFDKHVQ